MRGPGPLPATPSTTTGMYGRLIWVARYDTPKIRKMRRTVGSARTAADRPERERRGLARSARPRAGPRGTRTPRAARSPTDSPAESQNTAGQRPAEPIDEDAGERRTEREPDRPRRAEDAIVTCRAGARGVTSRMPASITPGVPELEPDQQHLHRELPRLARERDAREDDRLDEGAPDDDGLAAVLVGPDAPERHERHADDEDQRR